MATAVTDIETRVRLILADTVTGAYRWTQTQIVGFLKNDALPWLISERPSARYGTDGLPLSSTTIVDATSTIPTDPRWDEALIHRVVVSCLMTDPTNTNALVLAGEHNKRAKECSLR